MRFDFDVVRARRTKTGACPVCQKRTQRSQVFEHTVNPYNKNSDGSIKSHAQVREDVLREADAWEPDFRHEKCRGAEQ
jgi:hypothetical protein